IHLPVSKRFPLILSSPTTYKYIAKTSVAYASREIQKRETTTSAAGEVTQ
ncbi:hypothetical protein BgiMline_018633, partial [Biomphalaria glabrata]